MDKLKKYLRDHEVEMEFDVPDDSLWQRIDADMPAGSGGKTIMLIKRLVTAACVAGVIGAGAWYWFSLRDNGNVKNGLAVTDEPSAKRDSLLQKDSGNIRLSPETAIMKPPAADSLQAAQSPVKPYGLAKREAPLDKEIVTISSGYTRIINYKLKELRSTAIQAESPAYFSLFTNRLRKMEKDERHLREDLNKYGINDELLEQLINLYQQKLNLLKSLQAEINKMNNQVNEKRSPSQKGSKFYLNI